VLNGYGDNDVINGGEGNDTILGTGGDDILNGGPGNDDIDGGMDGDVIHGNEGNDVLATGWGLDTVYGDEGDDTLRAVGPYGAATLVGGPGSDVYQLPDLFSTNVVMKMQDAEAGADSVHFTGEYSTGMLWFLEADYNSDSKPDLAIRIIGSSQTAIVENWQESDNQFAEIIMEGGLCSIDKTGIQGMVTLAAGVEPGAMYSWSVLSNYWTCLN
jgi:Ca2+-binding RTX toxin-like protein